jgi:hypothetical protein
MTTSPEHKETIDKVNVAYRQHSYLSTTDVATATLIQSKRGAEARNVMRNLLGSEDYDNTKKETTERINNVVQSLQRVELILDKSMRAARQVQEEVVRGTFNYIIKYQVINGQTCHVLRSAQQLATAKKYVDLIC